MKPRSGRDKVAYFTTRMALYRADVAVLWTLDICHAAPAVEKTHGFSSVDDNRCMEEYRQDPKIGSSRQGA